MACSEDVGLEMAHFFDSAIDSLRRVASQWLSGIFLCGIAMISNDGCSCCFFIVFSMIDAVGGHPSSALSQNP